MPNNKTSKTFLGFLGISPRAIIISRDYTSNVSFSSDFCLNDFCSFNFKLRSFMVIYDHLSPKKIVHSTLCVSILVSNSDEPKLVTELVT